MSKIVKLEELDLLSKDIYGKFKEKANINHTHTADQVAETETRKYVTPQEKEQWNAKITQVQLDNALNQLASGLTWKGSFSTLEELKKLSNPKDGWFAIVTQGQNKFYVYESSNNVWQDLGGLMLPGVASSTSNGLMTTEMVKKLASLSNYTLPIATSSILGGVKSGSIITVSSTGVLSIDGSKLINSDERNKWNKAISDIMTILETMGTIQNSISTLSGRMATAEQRITSIENNLIFTTTSDINEIIAKYR